MYVHVQSARHSVLYSLERCGLPGCLLFRGA